MGVECSITGSLYKRVKYMIAFWCSCLSLSRDKKVVFLIPFSGTKEEGDDLSSWVEEASRRYGTKGQQGMMWKLYKSGTITQVSEFIAIWFMMSLTYYVSANFCLNFLKVLPSLTRVKGLQVPGGAFADLLMLQEFVHNFGEALDLGKRTEFTF